MTTWAAEFVITNGQYIAGAMPLAAIPITRVRAWVRDRRNRWAAIMEHQRVETWLDDHPDTDLGYWTIRERIEQEARWAAIEAARVYRPPSSSPDPDPAGVIADREGVPAEVVSGAISSAVDSWKSENGY